MSICFSVIPSLYSLIMEIILALTYCVQLANKFIVFMHSCVCT